MSSDRDRYDVVVVGARAAGAAVGMLLADAGLSVLIVDRSQYGADTLSTHAIMRAGVLQLHRWGLLDRIIDAGTPPIRQTTFRYAHDGVTVPVKSAHGVDALYAPRRTVLDATLVDAAVAAGADVRYGVSVDDVVRDDLGRVTGIRGRSASGQAFRAEARLVIGADGLRSTVARRVGARFERVGTAATATTYGYWSGLQTDGAEWNFRPDAVSGVLPTNNGEACVFVVATPRRIGRGGPDVLEGIVVDAWPDLAARLASAGGPRGVRTFGGQPGHIRTSGGAGWALVGDAGYYKDPVSAHGLTDALRDAELLARAVIDIFTGDVTEQDALAGYQWRRNDLSRELFNVTDVIAGHGWTDEEIPGLLLRMSAAMTDEVEALADLSPLARVPVTQS
jgi:flavin-dependent dehydrogenase